VAQAGSSTVTANPNHVAGNLAACVEGLTALCPRPEVRPKKGRHAGLTAVRQRQRAPGQLAAAVVTRLILNPSQNCLLD
jgi:hypothetical protein